MRITSSYFPLFISFSVFSTLVVQLTQRIGFIYTTSRPDSLVENGALAPVDKGFFTGCSTGAKHPVLKPRPRPLAPVQLRTSAKGAPRGWLPNARAKDL
jgi:hypothetical protein